MALKKIFYSAALSLCVIGYAKADTDYLALSAEVGDNNTSINITFNPGDSQISWFKADTGQMVGQVQLNVSSTRLTVDGRMLYKISGLQCGTEYDIQAEWVGQYHLKRGLHIKTKICEILQAPKEKL